MSFCFNFDLPAQTTTNPDSVDGNELQNRKKDNAAKPIEDNTKPAEPLKEAKEHLPQNDPQFLLMDAVTETVTIGTLPPLHFLNETVFEKTASERKDEENILSRTSEQRSDLISGVYEGGLKVWECTYDLLELIEKDGETFGGKTVLDLGCGAGLLGILALKRGAKKVHFQDYNSTVVEQLTVPNVILNCQEDDKVDSEDEEASGKGKIQEKFGSKIKAKEEEDVEEGNPAPKKRAIDLSEQLLLAKCRFFSGDWSTFLALVKKEDPQPKYDIIFTSETIYNTAYYPTLHETLHKLLSPGGLVYLATKSHYFGVGGGLHLFETFVEQRGIFSLDHLWDGEEGLQRHVVVLRFKMPKDT
ncbi:Histidine protein methyltransferase 1-like protein Methyltransferase-like protein 18 [Larimichthys crocea]|uniref:protein-histidine N-methyltransferase n=1 Tax=Larimichthys crocea TaxID=215358 RepID=A0A6G0HN44_LARCR|nr:Histidine protein methyltransferase 1-like protein Methyltransferase-like protein 18 [Larimichthys crocea]